MIVTIGRRELLVALGGAAVAWPLAAGAQQPEGTRRIGVLGSFPETDAEGQARIAALRKRLQDLGWTEGRNIRLDLRWSSSDADLVRKFAKELVDLQPNLIVTESTPLTAAVLHETRTIPIVFVQVGDPVGSGIVTSMPHPGGQCHRLHQYSGHDYKQMARVAQGDCAAHRAGRVFVPPCNSALCSTLSRSVPGRGLVYWRAGCRITCSESN